MASESEYYVDTGSPPTVTIRTSPGWAPVNLRKLWAHRELLYFPARRDIKVHYKQTLLDFAQALRRRR